MSRLDQFQTPDEPLFISRSKGILSAFAAGITATEIFNDNHTLESVLVGVGAGVLAILMSADAISGKKRYLLMTVARKIEQILEER